jgi:hypothetical protein
MKINWAAVRALRRVMQPINAAQTEAAALDAGFDAGEWSGPAHARLLDELEREATARVAARFGLTPQKLCNMETAAEWNELRRFQESHILFCHL